MFLSETNKKLFAFVSNYSIVVFNSESGKELTDESDFLNKESLNFFKTAFKKRSYVLDVAFSCGRNELYLIKLVEQSGLLKTGEIGPLSVPLSEMKALKLYFLERFSSKSKKRLDFTLLFGKDHFSTTFSFDGKKFFVFLPRDLRRPCLKRGEFYPVVKVYCAENLKLLKEFFFSFRRMKGLDHKPKIIPIGENNFLITTLYEKYLPPNGEKCDAWICDSEKGRIVKSVSLPQIQDIKTNYDENKLFCLTRKGEVKQIQPFHFSVSFLRVKDIAKSKPDCKVVCKKVQKY